MSYEGYERWLCWNGHLHVFDCYTSPSSSDWRCSDCGETRAWLECVDQTNDGGHPSKLRIKTRAVHEKCSHCGTVRVTSKETYRVPKSQRSVR